MKNITKKKLLKAINKIFAISEYDEDDYIFSQKYSISPVVMVYILLELAQSFDVEITDSFIDALDLCTFGQLERLISKEM
ncbi:MAG: hypothetical protein FWC20_09960 [Oscillospiraceae bacterium]|nr:hypothetical protein [Oscillospiraceae bacterium]MCL2279712.1 hypothetical protein [Oscillospiraceae bacterium]